jgi:hypothetical protein
MQIDLQQPLVVDSVIAEITKTWESGGSFGSPRLKFERDGNVVWVELPEPAEVGTRILIHIHYHGMPKEAKQPPWDGGWIWKTAPEPPNQQVWEPPATRRQSQQLIFSTFFCDIKEVAKFGS